jgi:hypothetical protein
MSAPGPRQGPFGATGSSAALGSDALSRGPEAACGSDSDSSQKPYQSAGPSLRSAARARRAPAASGARAPAIESRNRPEAPYT